MWRVLPAVPTRTDVFERALVTIGQFGKQCIGDVSPFCTGVNRPRQAEHGTHAQAVPVPPRRDGLSNEIGVVLDKRTVGEERFECFFLHVVPLD